jgi:prepilin peptidase CpaA
MVFTPAEVLLIAAGAVAAVAAVTDLRTGHIPNWLTLPPLVAAPATHFFLFGSAGLTWSLVGLFFCGILPYVLFRIGALGGGDVKLFAALGAILGFSQGSNVLLASAMLCAAGGILRALRTGQLAPALRNLYWRVTNAFRAEDSRHPLAEVPELELRMGPYVLLAIVLLAIW